MKEGSWLGTDRVPGIPNGRNRGLCYSVEATLVSSLFLVISMAKGQGEGVRHMEREDGKWLEMMNVAMMAVERRQRMKDYS